MLQLKYYDLIESRTGYTYDVLRILESILVIRMYNQNSIQTSRIKCNDMRRKIVN